MVGPLLRVLLLASLVVVPAPTFADDQPPPEEVDVPRPPQAEIDAAVARGVAWLRTEQDRPGSFGTSPGETALALLALRHSGVPAEDKACRRAAASLERELPDGTVYGAALGIVALLAQDAEAHRRKVERLVEDIVEAQCTNGQWTYAYRQSARKKSGDNSNSQFAMLALAVARAQGLQVPVEPFTRCATFLRETQNEDGGYGYSDKERRRSYASMTAGGAMCLAFAVAAERGEAVGLPKHAESEPVRRALGWLADNFEAGRNTGIAAAFGNSKRKKRSDAMWRHYWLWSLERAAASVGADRLGDHDWYAKGARVLLDRQGKKGQWHDPERGLLATCFALLFFRRSTRQAITPRDRVAPAVTPSGDNTR